jgi:hypothetical protein
MLRRIKKDVENEIGPKTEYEILCEMTERQRILYNSIKEKLTNISDLFSSVDSKVKVENLMNLVMQFRKVCNHPELFERHFGKVPFIFRDLVLMRTSTFVNANNIVDLRCDIKNVINFNLPKLIYDECYNIQKINLEKFSIFRNNFSSLFDNYDKIEDKNSQISYNYNKNKFNGLFNFVGLFKFSQNEFLNLINSNLLINHISLIHYLKELSQKNYYFYNYQLFNENNIRDNNDNLTYENPRKLFYSYNKFSKDNIDNKYTTNYFNIFVNQFLYAKNEQLNFFKNPFYSEKCRPLSNLIFNSAKEIKDTYLYSEFNVILKSF